MPFLVPRNTEQVSPMKDYFIGQGTWIRAQFDTLEEMLAYHEEMPDLDRHFCKLYDHRTHKYAEGWAVGWSQYDKSDPWRDWT